MDWPTVVKQLRDESNKDRSRAADLDRIDRLSGGGTGEAVMLRLSSLVCSRLALAFEAGHVAEGAKPLKEENIGRKRGRQTAFDAAIEAPTKPRKTVKPSKASKDFMAAGWGNKAK